MSFGGEKTRSSARSEDANTRDRLAQPPLESTSCWDRDTGRGCNPCNGSSTYLGSCKCCYNGRRWDNGDGRPAGTVMLVEMESEWKKRRRRRCRWTIKDLMTGHASERKVRGRMKMGGLWLGGTDWVLSIRGRAQRTAAKPAFRRLACIGLCQSGIAIRPLCEREMLDPRPPSQPVNNCGKLQNTCRTCFRGLHQRLP